MSFDKFVGFDISEKMLDFKILLSIKTFVFKAPNSIHTESNPTY